MNSGPALPGLFPVFRFRSGRLTGGPLDFLVFLHLNYGIKTSRVSLVNNSLSGEYHYSPPFPPLFYNISKKQENYRDKQDKKKTKQKLNFQFLRNNNKPNQVMNRNRTPGFPTS